LIEVLLQEDNLFWQVLQEDIYFETLGADKGIANRAY
jgi:hypothetical protein